MPNDLDLPHLLRSRLTVVATSAALHAGAVVMEGFGKEMKCTQKEEGEHNLVTEWDRKAEEVIIGAIQEHFPSHAFLGEESGRSGEKQEAICWIIDPIDGTVNYAHGIPLFAISIAATFQGEVLAGAVYDPVSRELFTAEKGMGAYLNGKRLKVSATQLLDSAIAATGLPYNVNENPLSCLDHLITFAKIGIPIRRMGAAALDLAYVAAGRYDFFWEVSLKPWDFAAGKLLIEEAGGQITSFKGEPLTQMEESPIVASNKTLHASVLRRIHATLERS